MKSVDSPPYEMIGMEVVIVDQEGLWSDERKSSREMVMINKDSFIFLNKDIEMSS